MLLKLAEELPLGAPTGQVWKLLRDTPRLTSLLPGVESVEPLQNSAEEAYAAMVSEKIGPFKIIMTLDVRVIEAMEPSLLKVRLKGADSLGVNRVTGTMQVGLTPAAAGTQMRFEASIEVLGRLATLGAVPVRRRTAQIFAEFARNIQNHFAASDDSVRSRPD